MIVRRIAVLLLAAGFVVGVGRGAEPVRRPLEIADLFRLARVADPQISPDGRLVVWQVTTVHPEANGSSAALWIAPADGSAPARPLTTTAGTTKDTRPRWSPDGTTILFQSDRSGSSQLWTVPAAGGVPTRLTGISTGAEDAVWSPDGRRIAFVSMVRPEYSQLPFAESDSLNAARERALAADPVKARTFTRLFFRHWDSFVEDKRRHLFVIDASGAGCRDVTPGDRDAAPTSKTFAVADDHCFSPDSRHLVFTAVPATGEAWSTDHDLCRVAIDAPTVDWQRITPPNPAADNSPRYSPDGRRLAWRAQRRPGYEADKWDVVVADANPDGTLAGPPRNLTSAVDVSAGEIAWASDTAGRPMVAFLHEVDGTAALGRAFPDGRPTDVDRRWPGMPTALSTAGRGAALLVTRLDAPAEVYTVAALDGGTEVPRVPVSRANEAPLAGLDLRRPRAIRVPVEGGATMQMWILEPPGFDAARKWPVAYLVHGGPQGAWEDSWGWRWNAQLWAARGYVVVMPNPRGSTGFGQAFVDEITGDWGGKCYRDLVAGLDATVALPFVDPDRIATAGASFGGYMMNWFAVNDVAPRFRCLVSHCSVWNFESMWGTTDELWFDENDHGGLPWEQPGRYREFSPHARAGELGRHKTPFLVIHNDLDFRCPIGQGHELFAALQRQGVPSRFVNFPDEGHWVNKPANACRWHEEVFGWIERWCPPGGR
ncbi:MAG: S9 family peptidase [Planctomycetes bacterium]|nr:S9 family peptidase [Planctomycetota bacterium]